MNNQTMSQKQFIAKVDEVIWLLENINECFEWHTGIMRQYLGGMPYPTELSFTLQARKNDKFIRTPISEGFFCF